MPADPGSTQVGRRVSALFEFLNAGKSVLRLPEHAGAEVLSRLLEGRVQGVFAEQADPVLALARERGLDAVEIVGYPREGPGTGAPLSEFGVLALSGMLDMIGDPAREPLRLGGHQAAYAAGMSAFTAMMALLSGREVGRAADVAKVSLIETMVWVNWKAVSAAQAQGRAPSRRGAKAEFQVLRCLDGWIALVFTVTQYDALVRLVDIPALSEPRFANRAARVENGEAFIATLAPWFAQRRRDDIYQQAQDLGVPLGPVVDAGELLDDPQHLARAFIATVAHPVLGARPLGCRCAGATTVSCRRRCASWRGSRRGGRRRRGARMNTAPPLAGVRVIDFGQLTAGANTSAMLGDLGRRGDQDRVTSQPGSVSGDRRERPAAGLVEPVRAIHLQQSQQAKRGARPEDRTGPPPRRRADRPGRCGGRELPSWRARAPGAG